MDHWWVRSIHVKQMGELQTALFNLSDDKKKPGSIKYLCFAEMGWSGRWAAIGRWADYPTTCWPSDQSIDHLIHLKFTHDFTH